MIYALSDGIQVAIVGGTSAVLVAMITGIFASRSGRQAKNAIGKPNGKGNVVEMLENLTDDMVAVRADVRSVKRSVVAVKSEQKTLSERMKTLEVAHQIIPNEEEPTT